MDIVKLLLGREDLGLTLPAILNRDLSWINQNIGWVDLIIMCEEIAKSDMDLVLKAEAIQKSMRIAIQKNFDITIGSGS